MRKKMGVKTIFYIIGFVFFSVGLITVIVGSVITVSNSRFRKNAETTEAVIVDIESYTYHHGNEKRNGHEVLIAYTVDGFDYKGNLNEYNSGMHIGDKVKIYYDPDDPSDFRSGSNVIYIVVFAAGALWMILGGIFIVINICSAAKRNKLIQNGDALTGKITNVVVNSSVRINGRHPYKAECEVINPYDGEKYLYSSKNITQDISYLVGLDVTVYVDKNDRGKYYVDIEGLMKSMEGSSGVHDYR